MLTLSSNFQWSVDFKLEMRKDKKDVSKIEEIEENRQSTATNAVYQGKVAQKLDHVLTPKEKPQLPIPAHPLS